MKITGILESYTFVTPDTSETIECYRIVYDLGRAGRVEVPVKKPKAQLLLLAYEQAQGK